MSMLCNIILPQMCNTFSPVSATTSTSTSCHLVLGNQKLIWRVFSWKSSNLTTNCKSLASPGWPFGCLFGCHHAEKGLIHRKILVDCPKVITSIGDTLFQTRLDQELGIICQASLLHGWHWVLFVQWVFYIWGIPSDIFSWNKVGWSIRPAVPQILMEHSL